MIYTDRYVNHKENGFHLASMQIGVPDVQVYLSACNILKLVCYLTGRLAQFDYKLTRFGAYKFRLIAQRLQN